MTLANPRPVEDVHPDLLLENQKIEEKRRALDEFYRDIKGMNQSIVLAMDELEVDLENATTRRDVLEAAGLLARKERVVQAKAVARYRKIISFLKRAIGLNGIYNPDEVQRINKKIDSLSNALARIQANGFFNATSLLGRKIDASERRVVRGLATANIRQQYIDAGVITPRKETVSK